MKKKTKTKIADLDISEPLKRTLAVLYEPKSIMGVAVKLKISYNLACQNLAMLKEMGLVIKIKTSYNKTLYQLSQKVDL